jgi:diguanylate cyclase (GGDEF)-like protein
MADIRMPGRVAQGAGSVLRLLRASQVWGLSEPLRSYVLAVPALYVVALTAAGVTTTWRIRSVLIFLALVACGVATTEATRLVREPQGTLARDLQSVWYLAIAVTLPPFYALAAPIPLVVHKLWRTRRMIVYRRLFSHAAIGLSYGLASVVFHSMPSTAAGPGPGSGLHALSWVAVAAACGLIAVTVNHGFVLVAIRLSDPDVRIKDLIGTRDSLTTDLLELSLAVSLTLVVALNPVLMALALPTVVLCRRYLMQSQLVAQARIDAKTGLLNAGTWQREATAEFYRALRSGAPLALVMVDIDHFSSVNETAGIDAGDQVLHGIARTLTENLQGSGLVGRFGGKQFAILLPQTGETAARRIAERLRDHVAGEPIAIEDGSHAGFVFRLTVSIGIAVLDRSRRALGGVVGSGLKLGELIGAADGALSQAKATGRNKVCVVPPSAEQG